MLRTSFMLFSLYLVLSSDPTTTEEIRFRSGNIQVENFDEQFTPAKGEELLGGHSFYRGGINFGRCFENAKYRRMPLTYYHSLGPAGQVFQKFNWFPGKVNTYHADARLPISVAALGCSLGQTPLPLDQLAALWSEPPVAVVGMAAGIPASYARPLQHFHFYEANDEVIKLNEPGRESRYFHFIHDALARGASIRIIPGPLRQQLAKEGPQKFYRLMILEACSGENSEKIVLDLFTKEGIAECFEHLADDGILCVHTSHKFIELPPVLAAIARELKLQIRCADDVAPGANRRWGTDLAEVGHWTSEWVMLARHAKTLDSTCTVPDNYKLLQEQKRPGLPAAEYWHTPRPLEQVWTDKGPNLLHGILRSHPFSMRYYAAVGPISDFVRNTARTFGARASTWVFIHEWFPSDLPRPIEDFIVRRHLKYYPEVKNLWP